MNVYRTKAYHSIMRGYFCIELSDFMLKAKVYENIQIYFLLMIMIRMIK